MKVLWNNREIKPVYELDPKNKQTKKCKATRWYIASQMKRSKDVHYEDPDILEPAPLEPSPEVKAYMEMVYACLEVHYRDFQEIKQDMERKLQQAGSEIVTLEAELRKAKERIHMLEDKVLCPSKFRRLV